MLGRFGLAGALLFAGCSGTVGSDPDPDPGGAPTSVVDPAPAAGDLPVIACEGRTPGPSPLRRLIRFDYNNTVRELLGDDTRPADGFPPEEELTGFDNDATVHTISDRLVERHFTVASDIAARAMADVEARLGCSPVPTGEDACVRSFIVSFGTRAFRRPLEADEIERLYAVYDRIRGQETPADGVRGLLTTILLSPQFLYRIERDAPGVAAPAGMVALDAHAIASRLSYYLWGSVPDAALLAAAESGELYAPDQVAAHARRMLEDPRAKEVIRRFHRFWFGIRDRMEKDAEVFPGFTPEIDALQKEETELFVESIAITGPDNTFQALFTAPYTFLNETLANFYGVPGVAGPEFRRVDLDPSRHAGFLTHGSLMSRYAKRQRTEPITRGLFVRGNIFCERPPDPPPGAADEVDVDPNLEGRARLEAHRENPACNVCHQLFDPLGLAFENFNGVGQWRDTSKGLAIDVNGEIVGTDVAGPFVGPVELAHKIAVSEQAQSCLVGRWFLFAHGRTPTQEDLCTIGDLEAALQTSGSIKDLIIALTQTDAFLRRKAL